MPLGGKRGIGGVLVELVDGLRLDVGCWEGLGAGGEGDDRG